MKKLIFAAIFCTFATVSIAAQSKADNFLGTWKLTKTKGSFSKGATINSMILKVSDIGGKLTIVKETQGEIPIIKQSFSTTRTAAYKISGASTTNIIPGQYGGVVVSYLDFLGKNKLRLRDTVQKTEERRQVIPFGGTEYWTVSDDGKTLIIEFRTQFSSSKAFFSKE